MHQSELRALLALLYKQALLVRLVAAIVGSTGLLGPVYLVWESALPAPSHKLVLPEGLVFQGRFYHCWPDRFSTS